MKPPARVYFLAISVTKIIINDDVIIFIIKSIFTSFEQELGLPNFSVKQYYKKADSLSSEAVKIKI